MKILYLGNDMQHANILQNYLQCYNHSVFPIYVCQDCIGSFREIDPEILFIDEFFLTLQNVEILQQIRSEKPALPILLLLSIFSNKSFLEHYANLFTDYLFKEHSVSEITNRIEIAILKSKANLLRQYRFHLTENCLFNYYEKKIIISGNTIRICPIEAEIMLELCRKPNQLISRDILISICWNTSSKPDNCNFYLTRYMVKIKRFLKDEPGLSIQNFRKKGYCLFITEKESL